MQVNTLPSCSKSGNFAKANLELEIEGSYRKMIPFFNFTAMYLLKLYRSFASLGYCRMMCDEDECLVCAVSAQFFQRGLEHDGLFVSECAFPEHLYIFHR